MSAAYILHRRPYRETSLLIDVFSCDSGRVALVAKGAHKGKSSKGALLQVFQPLFLGWTGRGPLATLASVEAPSSALELHGLNLYSGYYLNELLLKLLPQGEAFPRLFADYAAAVGMLSCAHNVVPTVRLFEVQVLLTLGVLVDCSQDWQGDAISNEKSYYLTGDWQFAERIRPDLSDAVIVNGNVLEVISSLQQQFLANRDMDFERTVSVIENILMDRGLKALTRALIDHALLGQVLKSRDMIREYMRLLKVT